MDEENLRMLKLVNRALRDDIPGYRLYEGMRWLEEEAGCPDLYWLLVADYLEYHNKGREYFSLDKQGRELLDKQGFKRPVRKDPAEKAPHRAGVFLLADWLESLDDVDRTKRYYNQDGRVFDVVAFTGGNKFAAVGEVEMDSNDYQGIYRDYQKLAAQPGESIWLVEDKQVGQQVLSALANRGVIDTPSKRSIRSIARINRNYATRDLPGLDRMTSMQKARRELLE